MSVRVRAALAVSCALAIGATACGSGSTSNSSSEPGGNFDGTIKIGYVTDLSGAYQSYGYPNLNGALVAAKQINDSGGVKVGDKNYQISFELCAANSEEAQAAACARKFTRDENLKFVMGGVGKDSPAVASVTDPAGAMYIATGTALASQIDKFHNVYVVLPSNEITVNLSVAAVKKAYPDVKSIAFIVSDEPTVQILPKLVAAFKAAGYSVVAQEKFSSTGESQDLTPQLTKVQAEHPDLIFSGWTSSEVAPVVKTNGELKVTDKVFTFTGPGTCDVLKDAIGSQKLVSNDLFGADLDFPQTEEAKKFAKEYLDYVGPGGASKYKNSVNISNKSSSIFFPDALSLLAKAMTEAGTVSDVAALGKAMIGNPVQGVQGSYAFNDQHLTTQSLTFCTRNVQAPAQRGSFILPPTAK